MVNSLLHRLASPHRHRMMRASGPGTGPQHGGATVSTGAPAGRIEQCDGGVDMSEIGTRSPDHLAGPWHAERWTRHHYDRLYIRSENGTPVGWFDLATGEVHAVEPILHERLVTFIEAWRVGPEAAQIPNLPTPLTTSRVERPTRAHRPESPDSHPAAGREEAAPPEGPEKSTRPKPASLLGRLFGRSR